MGAAAQGASVAWGDSMLALAVSETKTNRSKVRPSDVRERQRIWAAHFVTPW